MKTQPQTFPSLTAALAACSDAAVEDVKVLHPEAEGPEQVRAIVEIVRYRAARSGVRILIAYRTALSPGGRMALERVLEEPPEHVRFFLVDLPAASPSPDEVEAARAASSPPAPVPAENRETCAADLHRGGRCPNPPEPGDAFCWSHGGRLAPGASHDAGGALTITIGGAGPCPTCGGAATGCRQERTPAIAVTAAGAWIPPGERTVYRCANRHEWPLAAPSEPSGGGGREHVTALVRAADRALAGHAARSGTTFTGREPPCSGFLTVGCGEELAPPEPPKCTRGALCSACVERKAKRAAGPKCCDRAGEYNGFGSDGPPLFTCPKGCACHD
jgi:hypothetical protein